MDMLKIGAFLAELRREHDMTQEQLGEKLGVTNKTVSRWENGNYLPPVEMLQQLSTLYGISINEILSAQRLDDAAYRAKAEENIRLTLETSSFTLKEKIDFYKRKWAKEHLLSTVILTILFAGLILYTSSARLPLMNILALLMAFGFVILRHNLMMVYAEDHVFGVPGPGKQKPDTGKSHENLLHRMRIAWLIILGASLVVTADLGMNFLFSLIPELNDGLTIHGSIAFLIFNDDWSRERFYNGFEVSLGITVVLALVNIALACVDMKKNK